MKQKCLLLLSTFLLLCSVILGCGGSTDKSPSSTIAPTSTPVAQEANTPEQKLKVIAKKSIDNYGGILVKYKSVNIIDDLSGNFSVIVTCNGDILPNHKNTVAEYEIAAKKLAKDLYSSGQNINLVGLDIICPVVDTKTGENFDLHAWRVFIRKTVANNVKNWDGVNLKTLVDKADYKQHKILR